MAQTTPNKLIIKVVGFKIHPTMAAPQPPRQVEPGQQLDDPQDSVDLREVLRWALKHMKLVGVYNTVTKRGRGKPATDFLFVAPKAGETPDNVLPAHCRNVAYELRRLNAVCLWSNPDGSLCVIGAVPLDGGTRDGKSVLTLNGEDGRLHIGWRDGERADKPEPSIDAEG